MSGSKVPSTIAANAIWIAHVPGVVGAIGFIFFVLYGPFLIWVIRRNVGRWDAAHPD